MLNKELDIYLKPNLVLDVAANQDIYTDKLPVEVELEVLIDVKNTCEAEVQTQLRLKMNTFVS